MSFSLPRFSFNKISQLINNYGIETFAVASKNNALTPNRCFRTTSDGSIALEPEWVDFLAKARVLGKVAMQTRHAAARMIVVQEMPQLTWRPDGRWIGDTEGSLHFSFEDWGQAWGQLVPCKCCGSFGRVSVRNRLGQEFLQLCAVGGSTLASWGAFLEAAAGGSSSFHEGQLNSHGDGAAEPDADCTASNWLAGLPRLPKDAQWLPADAGDLTRIVQVLQGENLPVRWTLRASEFCHSRVFAPHAHELAHGGRVLTVRGSEAETMQLGLPLVCALAIGVRDGDCPLYVAGPDGARLLTISAADGRDEADLWRIIMKNYFPEIAGG